MEILRKRTECVDFVSARQDVEHFVGDPGELKIWSREYFDQLAQLIRGFMRNSQGRLREISEDVFRAFIYDY